MTSVVDVVRTYMDAASGLTRLTRQRAVVAAKTLLKVEDRYTGDAAPREATPDETTRGSVGAGIQSLASELVTTSAANREALGELVEVEIDRVLNEAGYVRREEHDRLLRRVADLERRLAAFPSSAPRDAASAQRDAQNYGREVEVPAPREPGPGTEPAATQGEPETVAAADAVRTPPTGSGPERDEAEQTATGHAPDTATGESDETEERDTSPSESTSTADTETGDDSSAAGSGTRSRSGTKATAKSAGRTRSTKSAAKKSSGKTGKSK